MDRQSCQGQDLVVKAAGWKRMSELGKYLLSNQLEVTPLGNVSRVATVSLLLRWRQ